MPILAGRRTRGSSLLPLLLLVLAPRTGAAASEAALAKGDAKVLHHLADDWMPEGWDDGDPCLWPGVECAVPTGETERRVVSLSVRAVCVLQGHAERACDIPSNIGELSELQSLYLNGNGLQGPIPAELGALGQLRALYLNSNKLWGSLPREIGDLKHLERLHLNSNKLSGEIPRELAGATALIQLELHQNDFSGQIPKELGHLKNLVQLDLNDNALTGPIPKELGDLATLHRLYLHNNNLDGEIPDEVLSAKMGHLAKVNFSGNMLHGYVPHSLCRMQLTQLDVSSNDDLQGKVPHCEAPHGFHSDVDNLRDCKEQLRDFCGLARPEEL